jgi:hypothetical protein
MAWKEGGGGRRKGWIDPEQSARQLTVSGVGDLNTASTVVQTSIVSQLQFQLNKSDRAKLFAFFQQ